VECEIPMGFEDEKRANRACSRLRRWAGQADFVHKKGVGKGWF